MCSSLPKKKVWVGDGQVERAAGTNGLLRSARMASRLAPIVWCCGCVCVCVDGGSLVQGAGWAQASAGGRIARPGWTVCRVRARAFSWTLTRRVGACGCAFGRLGVRRLRSGSRRRSALVDPAERAERGILAGFQVYFNIGSMRQADIQASLGLGLWVCALGTRLWTLGIHMGTRRRQDRLWTCSTIVHDG